MPTISRVLPHAAPHLLVLVVARLGQPARHGEDQGERMLGHGAGIDAGGARQPDAFCAELLLGILVHA
jgi:hypothetical protein